MDLFRRTLQQQLKVNHRLYHRNFNGRGCGYGTSSSLLPAMMTQINVFPVVIPTQNNQTGQSTSIGLFNLGGIRTKIKQPQYKSAKRDPEAQRHYKFSYYPRSPDEVDPPYEPTKLFLVKRIKSFHGLPWWDKKLLYQLHLTDRKDDNGRITDIVIVKNTPETCALLYKIKHLIEMKPITFPNGLPKDANSGFLKENGEFITYSDIGTGSKSQEQLETDEKLLNSYKNKLLDGPTIRERLHEKWYSRF